MVTCLENLWKSVKKGFTGLLFQSIHLYLQAEGGRGWQWVTWLGGIPSWFKCTSCANGQVTTFNMWQDFIILCMLKKEDNLTLVCYFHFIHLWVIPCQNKEKKGQRQKIKMLWRNMKIYRVPIWFLPFLASIWFLEPFWIFSFSKFSKLDHFQKGNNEKLHLLFNFVSLDLTKKLKFPDGLIFMIFGFDFSLLKKCTF